MKTLSKAERKAYLENLRNMWQMAKEYAEKDEVKAAWTEAQVALDSKFSIRSFALIKMQMEEQGLEGTPYIDTKTFKAWKDSGYIVKKGSKSTLSGVVWLTGKDKKEDKKENEESEFVFPKKYSLFHKSQVEEMA